MYSSRHGTTARVARLLSEKIQAEQVYLSEIKLVDPTRLKDIDAIVIGGSIHFGLIQKDVRNFCTENLSMLLQKKIALFLCCMQEEVQTEQLNAAFPQELRNHSLATVVCGGEFLIDKMTFLEKQVVRAVSGVKRNTSALNYTAIAEFNLKINSALIEKETKGL